MSKLAAVNQAPLIFSKMTEVMRSIEAISKEQRNELQKYNFRGIDDVYNALHKPLADAGIFYIPEVLESKDDLLGGDGSKRSIRVKLKIKYTFYAEDGSSLSSIVEGEAIDFSDKATNKAFSAALKYMLIQVFCIPTQDLEDADSSSPAIEPRPKAPAPRTVRPVMNHATGEIVDRPTTKALSSTPMHCGKPMMKDKFGKPFYFCMSCKTKQSFAEGE